MQFATLLASFLLLAGSALAHPSSSGMYFLKLNPPANLEPKTDKPFPHCQRASRSVAPRANTHTARPFAPTERMTIPKALFLPLMIFCHHANFAVAPTIAASNMFETRVPTIKMVRQPDCACEPRFWRLATQCRLKVSVTG
jgi:hypothetical protein